LPALTQYACPLPHASFLSYEIVVHLKTGVSNKHHLADSSAI